jgi:predicted nucleic acid-binding protein
VTVIADTSPLNYLILIGVQDLLPSLYESIRIAPAGAAELAAPGAPEKVRQWIGNRPDWLVVTPLEDPPTLALHISTRANVKRLPLQSNSARTSY